MSRFGIRNRLKKMLDGGPAEITRHPVSYLLPDGTTQVVHAEEERVDRRPLEAERHRLENGRLIVHVERVRGTRERCLNEH